MWRLALILVVTSQLTTSLYYSAAGAASESRDFAKTYGIGAVVAELDSGLVVVKVMLRGPASRAGVTSGDRLIAVDGYSVEALDVPDVIEMLLSDVGSPVALDVRRSGVDLSFIVERALYWEIADGAGFRIESDSLGSRFVPSKELAPFAVGGTYQGLWIGDRTCAETFLPFDSGSPTFVYVWASWCGPCKWLMEQVSAQAQSGVPKDVRIVGINVDLSCDIARAAIDSLAPPGDQYWGYGMRSEASQKFRAYEGIPCGALFDGSGHIDAIGRGSTQLLEILTGDGDVEAEGDQ